MTNDYGRLHTVATHDGAVLRGRFLDCPEPAGLVVVRTPYDAAAHASTARSWCERGYHCLVQDVRGRYRSDGTWSPYAHEDQDGAATLAQLHEEHPHLPIVVYGASYAAHTAVEAARASAHPPAAVIVAVPALGLAETAWDGAGAPQIRHRIGWWHEHGHTRRARSPLPAGELDRRTAQAERVGVIEAAASWGWSPQQLQAWQRLWATGPIDLALRYGCVDAPLLVISGHEDFFDHVAHRLARCWPGPSHLATGPWGHTLTGGITEPDLRARVRAAGGLGAVIDPWLAARGLPGSPATWTAALPGLGSRTSSIFDTTTGGWHHGRAEP